VKIEKILMHGSFAYDDETAVLSITDSDGNTVNLNKIYSFSLHRFFTRIMQRNWLRGKPQKKPTLLKKEQESKSLANRDQAEINFVELSEIARNIDPKIQNEL
jgi:hypothetical protein